MSILGSFNALSKVLLGVGIVDAWQQGPQTKEASRKAEQLAKKKYLREAVTIAEKAIAFWSKNPGFWERWICKLLLSNVLDEIKQQLLQWRQQVAEADKLANQAKNHLQQDTGNPLETQTILSAIVLYQRCSQIIHDERVLQSIQQCQQELQQRQQFQVLFTQAESQAENRYFKNAIAIYHQAAALYPTESVKNAIATAETQVPQEEVYDTALQKAQQAESEGRLKGAIALLESVLTNFPRTDGLDLVNKLQLTVKGRTLYRQGLAAEKAGYLPAAASLYENAQSLLPDITNCRIRLGLVAIKTQDWVTAISHLEGIPGEQAAYLRGFALAQQDNLQPAYREWQEVSAAAITQQREVLKHLSQRQRLLSLKNIEQLVKLENIEQAKTHSREFLQKFGFDPLVEANLNQHIQPRLEAGIWQGSDWGIIADQVETNWILQPNITTLHNWTVATYYHAQTDPTKLNSLIIALSTALANITEDPSLQNPPWLGNKPVEFAVLSSELKRRLESAIDKVKDTNIQDYLQLRDHCRRELVSLKLMGESSKSGMKVNDVFITPGCYHRFLSQWQNIIVDITHPSQKILRSLYTPWGLAVAACLEGDSQRAIQLKPAPKATIGIEKFAEDFVAYYEGCYYLQQQKWRKAMISLKPAKSEIEDNPDWQQEIDKLCGLQRQAISEFSEHLEFAEFWYDLIGSNSAKNYLAEYKAEELRKQVINQNISLTKALDKLQEIKNIDHHNPVVIDLIESIELTQELEEIDWLLKNRQFEAVVIKARCSHRERVRYIVADFFINILINGVKDGDLNSPEAIQQLGLWAYEICPHEPAFQEVYRGLRLCW
ncbi:peptidase M, neutral zinc metallopeptidase site [Cylindrospermum sp. FACHB-282]|uniref:peptidase M, neutral zinc metallopeptidase site n=1 Tax=Cylindrospermum sp. FACHB-282 TaxID=2692794 RepID=UPI00168506F3|nr:peptidase M, neutral zinc metallopeptidase site [Cylindrospermum sp. FACHB-282]MBD2386404.1 peptidase M, neutral zinc metallopeptidase site [Cylindrospermum sp. FACHB-282]